MTAARIIFVSLLAAGCVAPPPSNLLADGGFIGRPPGLYSVPAQVAFTCVTPGCDETKTARITVSGDRRVAIKRILLDGASMADFSFSTTERPPFIVGAGAGFDVDIRYQPRGAPIPGSVSVLVTYTDASAEESDARLPPGELRVPMLRRLVGAPELAVTPSALSFGVVANGSSKTLPLALKNSGFGNIALEVTGLDAGSSELVLALPAKRSMLADAGIELPITWSPLTPSYLRTELQIFTSAPEVPVVGVTIDGTSLSTPRLAIEPGMAVDFGEVGRNHDRKLPLTLVNQGGSPLTILGFNSTDSTGNLLATMGDGGRLALDDSASLTVGPLQRVPMILVLNGQTPGDLMDADGGTSSIRFTSDDPDLPERFVTVKGTVTEPRVTLNPVSLDWGTVPQGWVVPKHVEVKSTGYGALTVKGMTFVSGSSMLYRIANKPALPAHLARGQRLAFDIEFRAETMAPATGSLSIETDDPVTPFVEVALTASVADCMVACPITNGTPSCDMGSCKVGMCTAGFYDSDKEASTGCECREVSPTGDPGNFCANGQNVGTLTDTSGDSTSFTGNVPLSDDVDVIYFFAKDANNFFGDDFHVRIRLDSADPGIQMCISYQSGHSDSQGCSLGNEVCGARVFDRDGSQGTEDGADVAVKIYRDASSTPVCTPYTVSMSNG